MKDAKKKDPILEFTGVARSVIGYDNQGFRNFKILTMKLEKGRVVEIQYSDPYANFEAISRLELWNELSILNLNSNWADGKAIQK